MTESEDWPEFTAFPQARPEGETDLEPIEVVEVVAPEDPGEPEAADQIMQRRSYPSIEGQGRLFVAPGATDSSPAPSEPEPAPDDDPAAFDGPAVPDDLAAPNDPAEPSDPTGSLAGDLPTSVGPPIIAGRSTPGLQLSGRTSQPSAVNPVAVGRQPTSTRFLRSTSIPARMTFLVSVGVISLVIMGFVSTWGVARSSAFARDIEETADASDSTMALALGLGELGQIDEVTDTQLEVARSYAQEVELNVGDSAASSGLAQASQVWERYFAARENGATADDSATELQRAKVAAEGLVTSLASERNSLIETSETHRKRAVVTTLVALALLICIIAIAGRLIAGSIVDPTRLLGRVLRRFGDGDHSVRAEEAFDEVGMLGRSFNLMASSVGTRLGDLSAESQRSSQLRMIAEALDLADNESDIHRVIERALGMLTPGVPSELLLHEMTSKKLSVVASNPTAPAPGCTVEDVNDCPAMRSARPLTFVRSKGINACDSLQAREPECSAVCLPVTVGGHMLGVLHATGPDGSPPSPQTVTQLEGLCAQVGARISAMRTLESTRLQASTDGLTGLANRRMLEAKLSELLRTRTKFVIAVADLDHFKSLNDQYGHEVGDKALQLFASVLEDNIRDRDIVARYGGEEFVLVYPEMSVKTSIEVINRIRAAMVEAISDAGLPQFTVSMGVTHSSVAETVESLIRIADAGLFVAKDMGRNRVVFSDEELAAEVFGTAVSPRDPDE